MEQIVITHPNGERLHLFSKQRPSAISKATQKVALLSDDLVSLTVVSAEPLNFDFGDVITIFGKPYKLNQLPEPTKEGERKYTYEVTLEGTQYDLIDVIYKLPEGCYGEQLYGDLEAHLNALIWNLNRIYPGKWILGTFPANTPFKNLNATGKNCLQVLQEYCEQYGVEFGIVINTAAGTYTLNIVEKVGVTQPFTLQYGRGKGLYKLQRKNINNAGITTRLYAYGGSNNLGSSYGHNKLCLPGTTRLTSYVESATGRARYGIKENEKTFDDIKPERLGEVTSLGGNVLSFTDSSMFDLNEREQDGTTTKYLIEGATAKITFQTGNLAGYSFDVRKYDHTTHMFVINKFTDENGTVFPSETSAAFQIAVGDKYIIEDINLPQQYVTDAEARLLEQATKELEKVEQPQVSYALELDAQFFAKTFGQEVSAEVLHVGDFIRIVDEGVGVDKEVRITRIERNLLKEHSYSITLADTVQKSNAVRLINEIKDINDVINLNGLADPAVARRRWQTAQELLSMVFDPDGDYFSEKIKPLSIETAMLAVGAKSQQFVLKNVTFEPNYNSSYIYLRISAGTLEHYAISEEGVVAWNIAGVTLTLDTSSAYYIYARCSKANATGSWLITTTRYKVEDVAGYYMFLVGTVSSPQTIPGTLEAVRSVSLTYGFSTVNGRHIKTGRIESTAGNCYFDLDNNQIGGVLQFVKSDGTVGNVADINTKADNAKDYIDNTMPNILDGIQAQLDGKIETYYTNDDPAASWVTTEEQQKHIGDIWYNTANQQGDANRAYRYGTNLQWKLITDDRTIQALAAAAAAQDTADGKRRVFTAQPKPPYDVGDLWAQGENGELLKCINARASGNYVASDWAKACGYTNDSSLNEFINLFYNPKIAEIEAQLDGVIETWFYSGVPTLSNLPARNWATDADKEKHLGDLYYDNASGIGYRFSKDTTGSTTTYMWVELRDSAVAEALAAAARAQDTADNKRRVFVSQPYPPYDVGDLWTDGTDLKRCIIARAAGNYDASDWDKATNYTGDENLNTFVNSVYARDKNSILNQIDGKIESWFQTTDPADNWQSIDKPKHVGDIWYNTSGKRLFRYVETTSNVYDWEEIKNQDAIDAAEAASNAQDTADGKRRVFTSVPVPPYDPGDLWVQGSEGGILVCVNGKTSGSYENTDFAIASKYTGDENLIAFIEGTYAQEKQTMQNQIDGKIESWFQDTDPAASWVTTEAKELHVGDMWYYMAKMWLLRYVKEGDDYGWARIYDKDALDAAAAAAAAQDTADGKRRVFTEQPYPPYDVGDLWLTGGKTNGQLFRCVTARATGSYRASDWAEAVYYDNTKTTIDGGIVTSGTVQLVSPLSESIVAGITGGENETSQTEAKNKVRIWAGASKAQRFSAPFRVLQDGTIYATKANIEGTIKATDGEFRGKVYATDGEFAGRIYIGNGAIRLEKDGSGSLGNGQIHWQADYGALTIPFLNLGQVWGFNQLIVGASQYNPVNRDAALSFLDIPDNETVYLPSDPHTAFIYTIVNRTKTYKYLNGNGRKVCWRREFYTGYYDLNETDSFTLGWAQTAMLIFDGKWYVISTN